MARPKSTNDGKMTRWRCALEGIPSAELAGVGYERRNSSKSAARTRVATPSIMIERKRRSRPRSRIAGTAIPSFSLALKSPHARTTCFWVSQRIGNGNSYWRRTRSDCSGESTATVAMRTPRPRKSSKWSRNSANWRRQKGHQWQAQRFGRRGERQKHSQKYSQAAIDLGLSPKGGLRKDCGFGVHRPLDMEQIRMSIRCGLLAN